MGPPSYMRFVVSRNVVMRRLSVHAEGQIYSDLMHLVYININYGRFCKLFRANKRSHRQEVHT